MNRTTTVAGEELLVAQEGEVSLRGVPVPVWIYATLTDDGVEPYRILFRPYVATWDAAAQKAAAKKLRQLHLDNQLEGLYNSDIPQDMAKLERWAKKN